jgi:hypothetical protein
MKVSRFCTYGLLLYLSKLCPAIRQVPAASCHAAIFWFWILAFKFKDKGNIISDFFVLVLQKNAVPEGLMKQKSQEAKTTAG